MSWELTFYNASDLTIKRNVLSIPGTSGGTTLLNAEGVHGGFRALVEPSGNCKALYFQGRNDILNVSVGDIVSFDADATQGTGTETRLFFGVVSRAPKANSSGGSADNEFEALGADFLLKKSRTGPRLIEGTTSVENIAFIWCQLFAHPALSTSAPNFEASGSSLSLGYRPQADLLDNLRRLADQVGFEVGVDADGQIFFRQTTGSHSLNYDELQNTPLPNEVEHIVTEASITLAGSTSERVTPIASNVLQVGTQFLLEHYPLPVSFDYQATVANGYAEEYHDAVVFDQSFQLPEYLTNAPALPGVDVQANMTNFNMVNATANNGSGDEGVLFDENGTSFYSNTAADDIFQLAMGATTPDAFAGRYYGFRFAVWTHADFEGPIEITCSYVADGTSDSFRTTHLYKLEPTEGLVAMDYSICLPDARGHELNLAGASPHELFTLQLKVDAQWITAPNVIWVYMLYPLVSDEARLTTIAQNTIDLAHIAPQKIRYKGLLEPRKEMQLTGHPGGTLILDAKEYEYRLEDDIGLVTDVTLEAARLDEAGAINNLVSQRIKREEYAKLVGPK